MAKHELKIGTEVWIDESYETTDPIATKVIEDQTTGIITDLNEFEDDLYHVVFDGYLTDEGVDFSLWLKGNQLEVV